MGFKRGSVWGLLVLLALPVIVVPLIVIGRWVRRLSRTAQDTLAGSGAFASEHLSFIRTVQAFAQEDRARTAFDGHVEEAFAASRSRMRARPEAAASNASSQLASRKWVKGFAGSTSMSAPFGASSRRMRGLVRRSE